MASSIDATKPVAVSPTTQSVRDNFLAAKNEIEALQLGITKTRMYNVAGQMPGQMVTGTARWYPEGNIQVTGVFFSLGTAGVTLGCTAMVKKNNANFLSANITTAAGEYKSNTATPPSPNAGATDYFTVDAQSLGGDAKDMVVHIQYKNVA